MDSLKSRIPSFRLRRGLVEEKPQSQVNREKQNTTHKMRIIEKRRAKNKVAATSRRKNRGG